MAGRARRSSMTKSTHRTAQRARLARILASAEYVIGSREEARQWMNTPHGELNGKSPFEVVQTEHGARLIEGILDKLFFGLPA